MVQAEMRTVDGGNDGTDTMGDGNNGWTRWEWLLGVAAGSDRCSTVLGVLGFLKQMKTPKRSALILN